MVENGTKLETARALKAWEERRCEAFDAWRAIVEPLMSCVRTVIRSGHARHGQLAGFLKQRGNAERVYSQALAPRGTGEAGGGSGAKSAVSAGGAPKAPSTGRQTEVSFLTQLLELQQEQAGLVEGLAAGVLEGPVLQGASATSEEFSKVGSALLEGLETGLSEVVEAHKSAAEDMAAHHRMFFEAENASSSGAKVGKQQDAWQSEHRYRCSVETLQARQEAFTEKLCSAVEEARRLEQWREEMAHKTLQAFCQKLHHVATVIQSLANNCVCALADKQRGPVQQGLGKLDGLLQKPPPLPAGSVPPPPPPPASGTAPPAGKPVGNSDWPTLQRLRGLARTAAAGPPVSQLEVLSGTMKIQGKWYGFNECQAVITKDFWLHCYKSLSDEKPLSSIYLPRATVRLLPGKLSTLEIEENKKGFFGISTASKEVLRGVTEDDTLGWNFALQSSCKGLIEINKTEKLVSAVSRETAPGPPPSREAPAKAAPSKEPPAKASLSKEALAKASPSKEAPAQASRSQEAPAKASPSKAAPTKASSSKEAAATTSLSNEPPAQPPSSRRDAVPEGGDQQSQTMPRENEKVPVEVMPQEVQAPPTSEPSGGSPGADAKAGNAESSSKVEESVKCAAPKAAAPPKPIRLKESTKTTEGIFGD